MVFDGPDQSHHSDDEKEDATRDDPANVLRARDDGHHSTVPRHANQ